jgi:hypothetical protein
VERAWAASGKGEHVGPRRELRGESKGVGSLSAVLVVWSWDGRVEVEDEHTSPSFGVLHDALLGLFLWGLSWHWHVGQVI